VNTISTANITQPRPAAEENVVLKLPRSPSKPEPAAESSAPRQTTAVGGNPLPELASQARDTTEAAAELVEATQNVSDYIQTVSRSLQISVDKDLGSTVIKVLDTDTDQLIRQIPAEEILQIARFIAEQRASTDTIDTVKGLLLDGEG
jgi:flagellar protein FlaG